MAGDETTRVYVYADYWAAVLGLDGVVRDSVQQCGLVDLPAYRACLDRPEMRLPGWRYYVMTLLAGPVLIPYRMAQRLVSRLHAPRTGEEDAERLLSPCRLRLEPQSPGRVRASHCGGAAAADLLDPAASGIVFSLVYPTYKILAAAFFAIALTLVAQLVVGREPLDPRLETLLRFGHYPGLVLVLWAVFRDWITSFVAPIPVYLAVWALHLSGMLVHPHPAMLLVVLAGLALAYFIVDGVLVPRGLAPTLFLYDSDASSPLHPYEPGQAPEWVTGGRYWVWRFMYVSAAEINKIWERDWERVEVWVRADGPDAGRIDWVVLDFHYRELWLPYERLVSARHRAEHAARLDRIRRDPSWTADWIVEVDMNIVFHSPEVRGLYLMPLEGGWRRARVRQLLASLRPEGERDRPEDFRAALRATLLTDDFVADVPEHFRGYALRQLLKTPWRFWRYARGASSAARPYLYSTPRAAAPLRTSEPELQFKARAQAAPAPPVTSPASDAAS